MNIDYLEEVVEKATEAGSGSGSGNATVAVAGDIWLYVGIGVMAAVLIACLVLLIILMVKVNSIQNSMTNTINASNTHNQLSVSSGVGCVFCPSCGNPYDASKKECPNCGAKKMMY